MKTSIASVIDHTCLRPEAGERDIIRLCAEARHHRFAAVCIYPRFVPLAARELAGGGSAVCTVIGFPMGANTTTMKAAETADAIAHGAGEIDMVISIGALKDGDYRYVVGDIQAVVAAAAGRVVKVIIETGLLTEEEKIRAARLVVDAGAHYVKTCTGFGLGMATVDDVRLLRKTIGPEFGIKASGKIRDYAGACALIDAGATRIGTSSGVAIVEEERRLIIQA